MPPQASDRPNILVFLTDDHGQWAGGCYGAREIITPSLDSIAENGTRLTRAFTPCPVCSPARASFFTGRFPSQHGIHDWLGTRQNIEHPALKGQTTLCKLLHDDGYQTAMIGKWHCGHEASDQHHFDRWFVYDRYSHSGDATFIDQETTTTRNGCQAEILTEEALRFLRTRNADQPFFMVVGYGTTHSPFSKHPERLVGAYRGCKFGDVVRSPRPADYPFTVWPLPEGAALREYLAQYFSAVTLIDEQVGRIVKALESESSGDNTLVVYTSDHGLMCGQHDLWLKGNSTTPQNFLDESILVPCLIRWPNRIAAGQVIDAPVDHCDLFATLLDAAGALSDESARRTINSPGTSYLPLLDGSGGATSRRDAQICEYGNARMIRTETGKLIRRYGACRDEYYDLVSDPHETHNRIDDPRWQAEIARLGGLIEAFFDRHSIPGREGIHVMQQPACNPDEPWRRIIPSK